MKTLTADINLDEEVGHLAEFIRLKWSPISDIEPVLTKIRDAALETARGWFDDHTLNVEAGKLEDARAAMLKRELDLANDSSVAYYDALCTLLGSVSLDARNLREAAEALDGDWNFGTRVGKLHAHLADQYPSLVGARPLGWCDDELSDADERALQKREHADCAKFNGAAVRSTLAPEFPIRAALSSVMFEEKSRGRKATSSLVGAAFAHFLGIAKFLNTVKLVNDLPAALPQLEEPVVLFERTYSTANPVLKAAFELAPAGPTKAAYEECVAHQAQFETLSTEEQAERIADNGDTIAKMLERLMSAPKADQEQQWAAEKQHRINVLRAAFHS